MQGLSKLLFTLMISFSSTAFTQESDDAAQESEDATDIEEVIVTATSRETTLLDVPYNISTISGQEIAERAMMDSAELL